MEPGKPARRIEARLPLGVQCPPVRRRGVDPLDDDLIAARGDAPGHSLQFQTGVRIDKRAVAERQRTLRLRLVTRPAQLRVDRDIARHALTGGAEQPLAAAAFALPWILRSRSPSPFTGALPETRSVPTAPASTVASNVARPAPRRPAAVASMAGSARLRVCGAVRRLILTRQSPDGASGVPESATFASSVPVRPRPGAARSADG